MISRPIRAGKGSTRRAVLGAVALSAAGFGPATAANVDFPTWVAALRAEALRKGIAAAVVDDALSGLAPIPRVLELDRRQPELVQNLADYLSTRVTATKVENGRRRLAENAELLERVREQFDVQPSFIVALWGLESDYGRAMGDFKIVAALATLAYDGRRSAFFREELLHALRILDRRRMTAEELRGSWAGAMGQCQFMPSSFLAYAIDFDGDGRTDIWGSAGDVFASIANFLKRQGWRGQQGWGREVSLPGGFDRALVDPDSLRKPVGEWRALGVRPLDGRDLGSGETLAGISQPDGAAGRAFLVLDNFRTLRRWNTPQRFRIAVGMLADRLAET
jgi:membrane-bound lytic murein transglycosylase B